MQKMIRWAALWLLFSLSWTAALADPLAETERFFAQQESLSGVIQVPGRGDMVYYAQNDELWGGLTYEQAHSEKHRPFKDSGCGPTAAAMAVVQIVPTEELRQIERAAQRTYSLCSCSLNSTNCKSHHARYLFSSDRDYLRFLPLIIGDFAAGNNQLGYSSRSDNIVGTSAGFMKGVAEAYGLQFETSTKYEEALAALKAGKAVVAMAGKGGAFTNTGHYVILAASDEEQVYILDPLARTEYKTNHSSVIQILQPGLVSIRHTDIKHALFTNFCIFSR